MKQVLITGAGSGIGLATAQYFSSQGWMVYLLGRGHDKLQAAQKTLKNKSVLLPCDLSKSKDIESLKEKLHLAKSRIDVLVNNAGIYNPAHFWQETESSWQDHFETNLFGAVRLTRLLWQQLLETKGAITNVSSTLGLRPIENTGAYSASKAALNSWTQTLALEAGPLGVRVNAICPGLVDTPIHFFHNSEKSEHQSLRQKLDKMQPLQRMGAPEDIARAIYFISSESPWTTGALLPVDGGVSLTTRDP